MNLSSARTSELQRLLKLIESEEIPNPPTAFALAAAGLHSLQALELQHQSPQVLLATLIAVLAEREKAPQTQLELVWSGPEQSHGHTRSTAVVVREMFRLARKQVLLGGCYMSNGAEIFKPLHSAMRDQGVRARFCLDLDPQRQQSQGEPPEQRAQAAALSFLREQWPFGPPLPELYYDPRSFHPDTKSRLHAKCVVVDQEQALITSANFTRSGQNKNIEVGVLVRNQRFARGLEAHFLDLMNIGALLRCEIDSRKLWRTQDIPPDSDWDSIFDEIDPEYKAVMRELADTGLRAPDDYESDIAIQGRMSGCTSIVEWELAPGHRISLIRREDQETLKHLVETDTQKWIWVSPHDDPQELFSTLQTLFAPQPTQACA